MSATDILDSFYEKSRALAEELTAGLPPLPDACECGSTDFMLTEVLYERTSSLVVSESNELSGFTSGFDDYADNQSVAFITCTECDKAYNGDRIPEIAWT